MEALGRPTVVVATERFADLARQSGQEIGLDDARLVEVAHPVGGVPEEALRRRAESATDGVMQRLLGRVGGNDG
ncbi:MAG: hypothetical protein AAF430_25050 [Myxococcota bacterium]